MTRYIGGYATVAGQAGWLGEPKRFVISFDSIGGVQQQVLLTSEFKPTLVYTGNVSDPTAWPWYFERLMVIALAQTVCMALTGNMKLSAELAQMLEQQISISMQANRIEGLIIDDNTPEWIQALGINYPFRRLGTEDQTQQPNRKVQQ